MATGGPSVFQWILYVVGLVLVVVGTSSLWSAEPSTISVPVNKAYRFTVFEFWFVVFFAGLALFSRRDGFPLKNSGAFLAASAGCFFILVLSRDGLDAASVASANECRVANQANATFTTRRCLGGFVLAYIGVFLSFVAALPWAKPSTNLIRACLLVFQVICIIIGCAVIWSTNTTIVNPSATIWGTSSSGSGAEPYVIDDTFLSILLGVITIAATLLPTPELGAATVFFSSYVFCSVFTDMFYIVNSDETESDNLYAGYIIMTFGDFIPIILGAIGFAAGRVGAVGQFP